MIEISIELMRNTQLNIFYQLLCIYAFDILLKGENYPEWNYERFLFLLVVEHEEFDEKGEWHRVLEDMFLAHVFVMNRFRFLSLELFSGIIIIRDEDRAIHTQVKDTTKYYHSSVFFKKSAYVHIYQMRAVMKHGCMCIGNIKYFGLRFIICLMI